MTIKIFFNNLYNQQEEYHHVKTIYTENQGKNGKWLTLLFEPNTKEFNDFTHGECSISLDKKTEVIINK